MRGRAAGGGSAGGPRAGARPIPADLVVLLLLTSLVLVVALSSATSPYASRVPASGGDDGMALLRRAAEAGRATAYEGVQSVGSGNGAQAVRLVEVVHRPGEGTGFTSASPASLDQESALVVGKSAAMLAIDDGLLRDLAANYRVTRSGTAAVCGRTVTVIDARRADGTVAGRFWIDRETALPLRKDTMDASGRVAYSTGFVEVAVGEDTGPLPASAEQAAPWGDRLSAGDTHALRADGWHLPGHVAWDLRLVEARSTRSDGRPIVHLGYSDGLSMVSVFVQQGRLAGEAPGAAEGMVPVADDGGTVYVGDDGQQRRMWESGGFVYTVIADAPPELVDSAVAAFPAPDGSGLGPRMGRGLDRLGAWVGF
ncbi:sigma-E factor regulatory protein RseB domain-containing protein [Nocardiopsis sediminis]|uniref:Sigma-E factor regulatory protein RseB domain-containing protein n=1 Tax=Nocardiopsis sediminis TaxID=1778267 RepID=A0ABV8FQM0_9ACTN